MKPMAMFHTPTSWDELTDWVDRHNREDRPHLIVAAAMGWNLAISLHQLTEKESTNV